MSSCHIPSTPFWDTYPRPHTESTLDRKAPYNQPLRWGTCCSLSPWTMLVLRELGRSCSRSWEQNQDSKWSQPPFTSTSDPIGSAGIALLLLVPRNLSVSFWWSSCFNVNCRITLCHWKADICEECGFPWQQWRFLNDLLWPSVCKILAKV